MNTPTHYLDTINKRISRIQYLKVINQYRGNKLMQFTRLFNSLQLLKMQEQKRLNAYTDQEKAITMFYA